MGLRRGLGLRLRLRRPRSSPPRAPSAGWGRASAAAWATFEDDRDGGRSEVARRDRGHERRLGCRSLGDGALRIGGVRGDGREDRRIERRRLRMARPPRWWRGWSARSMATMMPGVMARGRVLWKRKLLLSARTRRCERHGEWTAPPGTGEGGGSHEGCGADATTIDSRVDRAAGDPAGGGDIGDVVLVDNQLLRLTVSAIGNRGVAAPCHRNGRRARWHADGSGQARLLGAVAGAAVVNVPVAAIAPSPAASSASRRSRYGRAPSRARIARASATAARTGGLIGPQDAGHVERDHRLLVHELAFRQLVQGGLVRLQRTSPIAVEAASAALTSSCWSP